jgi:glycosyltransferase involved in cell wall biosynthesis
MRMTTKPLPRISVVTPSFNQGEYLDRTIRSVLDQEYPELEFIILDGGSTDGSVDVIRRYESHLAHWVSEPDRGQIDALNRGFGLATGDLLTWLNSDDYYLPGALGRIAEAYRTNPGCAVITCLGRNLDISGNVKREDPPIERVTLDYLFQWLEGRSHFSQPGTAFTREAWAACGPLDESLQLAFDLDFWIKLKRHGFDFFVINEHLAHELAHPRAKTAVHKNFVILDIAVAILRHGGDAYVRPHLNEMIRDLTWYQQVFGKLRSNAFYRLIQPMVRRWLRTDARREQLTPSWARPEEGA